VAEADQAAFVSDPQVKDAMADTISDVSGVPKEFITVSLSIGRRLSFYQAPRRLASSVLVSYLIRIPQSATTASSGQPVPSMADIENNLMVADVTTVTNAVNKNIAKTVTTTYTAVTVASIEVPVVKVVTKTSTTSTATAIAVQAGTTDPEVSNGAVLAGVLGGLAMFAIISGIGVFAYCYRRRAGEKNQIQNSPLVEPDAPDPAETNEVPSPDPANPAGPQDPPPIDIIFDTDEAESELVV